MSKMTETSSDEQRRDAALELLNRESPQDYVAEWTAHIASTTNAKDSGTQSAVIFRIDREWLAIATDFVQEVIENYTIRTLPGQRDRIVRGLINVRGELLVCVALDAVLRMNTTSPRSSEDRIIVFARDRFAVQVSEVLGVHRFHPNDVRPAPATLRKASSGSYTVGILRFEGKTVACLDTELLLYAMNQGLA